MVDLVIYNDGAAAKNQFYVDVKNEGIGKKKLVNCSK